MYTSYSISIQHPELRNLKIQVIEPANSVYNPEGQASIHLSSAVGDKEKILTFTSIIFHDLSEIEEFADTILAGCHAYRDAHAPQCSIHNEPLDGNGICLSCFGMERTKRIAQGEEYSTQSGEPVRFVPEEISL